MRPPYPHPLIAREGWPFLAAAVLLSLAVGFLAGWAWSIPFWLLTLFVLQFFRDPAREVPEDAAAVVSPADGRIVEVSRSRDPWLERDALKVSVFMNVFNVHSNRSPVDGVVIARILPEPRPARIRLGRDVGRAVLLVREHGRLVVALGRSPEGATPRRERAARDYGQDDIGHCHGANDVDCVGAGRKRERQDGRCQQTPGGGHPTMRASTRSGSARAAGRRPAPSTRAG